MHSIMKMSQSLVYPEDEAPPKPNLPSHSGDQKLADFSGDSSFHSSMQLISFHPENLPPNIERLLAIEIMKAVESHFNRHNALTQPTHNLVRGRLTLSTCKSILKMVATVTVLVVAGITIGSFVANHV